MASAGGPVLRRDAKFTLERPLWLVQKSGGVLKASPEGEEGSGRYLPPGQVVVYVHRFMAPGEHWFTAAVKSKRSLSSLKKSADELYNFTIDEKTIESHLRPWRQQIESHLRETVKPRLFLTRQVWLVHNGPGPLNAVGHGQFGGWPLEIGQVVSYDHRDDLDGEHVLNVWTKSSDGNSEFFSFKMDDDLLRSSVGYPEDLSTSVPSLSSLVFEDASPKQAIRYMTKLAGAVTTGVEATKRVLEDPLADDPLVKKIMLSGDKDGKPRDEATQGSIQDEQVSVGKLVGTQSEIGLMNSVAWPLSSVRALKSLLTGDPTGAGKFVVVNDKKILDGHHRWSQVFGILGPGGKLNVRDVDIELPHKEALAVAQVAIKAVMEPGKFGMPTASGQGPSDNVLGKGKDEIASMLRSRVGDKTRAGVLLGDVWLNSVRELGLDKRVFGLKFPEEDDEARDVVIDHVASNLSSLRVVEGPERHLMPQFEGGDTHEGSVDPEDVVDALVAGEVNYKPPFTVKDVVTLSDDSDKESSTDIRRESFARATAAIIDRWSMKRRELLRR